LQLLDNPPAVIPVTALSCPHALILAIMSSATESVYVAITGTLSRPRREVVSLIESKTNARFCDGVAYHTNYLVASRFDTNKAKRAAKLGVIVIGEKELTAYVEQGHFPATPLAVKPPSNWRPIDLDALEYESIEDFAPPHACYLKYRNAAGEESERFILAVERVRQGTHEYIAGYDHECCKTFRTDRIVQMEDLGEIETTEPGTD
jgi:hypothetical protein